MDSLVAEKNSVCARKVRSGEMLALTAKDKLIALGDGKPLKVSIPLIRQRLSRQRNGYWYAAQAAGRIKRFLYLEQTPNPTELYDIDAAYAALCPEIIKKNRQENAALLNEFIRFAEIAAVQDAVYFAQQIEALRQQLVALGITVPVIGSQGRS